MFERLNGMICCVIPTHLTSPWGFPALVQGSPVLGLDYVTFDRLDQSEQTRTSSELKSNILYN